MSLEKDITAIKETFQNLNEGSYPWYTDSVYVVYKGSKRVGEIVLFDSVYRVWFDHYDEELQKLEKGYPMSQQTRDVRNLISTLRKLSLQASKAKSKEELIQVLSAVPYKQIQTQDVLTDEYSVRQARNDLKYVDLSTRSGRDEFFEYKDELSSWLGVLVSDLIDQTSSFVENWLINVDLYVILSFLNFKGYSVQKVRRT